jgi:hypothetical protein
MTGAGGPRHSSPSPAYIRRRRLAAHHTRSPGPLQPAARGGVSAEPSGSQFRVRARAFLGRRITCPLVRFRWPLLRARCGARARSTVRQQRGLRQLARCWREYPLLRDGSKAPTDSLLTGANAISGEIAAADPELAHPAAGDLDMCRLMWLRLATCVWRLSGSIRRRNHRAVAVVGNLPRPPKSCGTTGTSRRDRLAVFPSLKGHGRTHIGSRPAARISTDMTRHLRLSRVSLSQRFLTNRAICSSRR